MSIEEIITIAREYGATQFILFGSYAETPSEAHDLDLACKKLFPQTIANY